MGQLVIAGAAAAQSTSLIGCNTGIAAGFASRADFAATPAAAAAPTALERRDRS